MLDLKPSETHIVMTGVSTNLETISVVKITAGVNSAKNKLIKEHYLFCSRRQNGSIYTTIYFSLEAAINRFYERHSVAWDVKFIIAVPSAMKRAIPISVNRT